MELKKAEETIRREQEMRQSAFMVCVKECVLLLGVLLTTGDGVHAGEGQGAS